MDETRFFASDGLRLAYEKAGEGPPIVLVHGFASNFATNWRIPGTVQALVDGGFLAAGFDHRGHGRSERPSAPGAYRLEVLAQDVANFIDALGLKDPCLVGYSMGARVVLKLATLRPELARAIVLGGMGDQTQRVAGNSAKIAEALLAPDIRAIKDPIPRRFRQFAQHLGGDLRALAQCIREIDEPIDPAALERIRVPTLVIVGEKDDQVRDPESLAAQIQDAYFAVIPNRNHNTVVSDPKFKATIVDFLQNAVRASS